MSELIRKFQKNSKDTGSSAVQVILMTARIRSISDHIKTHPKDLHCRRGLMQNVNRRKSLLAYLKRTDKDQHLALVQALGLRH